jgi:hypothetical protein
MHERNPGIGAYGKLALPPSVPAVADFIILQFAESETVNIHNFVIYLRGIHKENAYAGRTFR